MYDPLTHPLPTREELNELQAAINFANDLMARMHRKHPNLHIRPYVNFSQGEFSEFHVDVEHAILKA